MNTVGLILFLSIFLFFFIDHVALILRYGNDDLVLFESTGKLVKLIKENL